jgi:hypothetical protein
MTPCAIYCGMEQAVPVDRHRGDTVGKELKESLPKSDAIALEMNEL